MAKPLIGVPLMGSSLFRKYMQGKYTRCLKRADAAVMLLEPVPGGIRQYLAQCDGFLFPGGPDIAPNLYGQEPQPGCGEPNTVRDDFEYPLLKAVLAGEKPVLCVCRGMQLLNVVQGGTLRQDIKPVQEFNHADFRNRAGTTHPVELESGSILDELFGQRTIRVNSLHHQAVDRLGDGLRKTAWSPDGFVEAVELKGRPFALGVQWHPEHMAQKDPAQQKIFERFAAACRAGMRG